MLVNLGFNATRDSRIKLQCMAEVEGKWVWLVYRCLHFFFGKKAAHITFSYGRNGFELN